MPIKITCKCNFMNDCLHYHMLVVILKTLSTIGWKLPGGGYGSSLVNRNFEIVDLLLYSPVTERYEIIRATRNIRERTCFVDIRRCRAFVKEYGNPGLDWNFEKARRFSKGWKDYNTESALRGFGYSVSQKENLSDVERQGLLADFIDLGVRPDSHVVSFLDFLIRSHPTDKDSIARAKWNIDKKFVENYKANPSRFLLTHPKEVPHVPTQQ